MLLRRRIVSPCLAGFLVVGPLAILAGCRVAETDPPETRRSVILITIDTLRADHLGSYGYPRDVSPFLDRLAASGLRFENVISPCSHTAPAHASIFTSLQPFQHGLIKNGQGLKAEFETLAEFFAGRGYDTAGIVSVSFLSELKQGFATFHAKWRSGDLTVDRALTWFEGRTDPGRPFFLWVHLYDPHNLKGSRKKLQADIAELRATNPEEGRHFVDHLTETRGLDPSVYPSIERLLERYDTYDAGIRFADRQLERLYRRIETAAPEALWVVTSDHGEGLGNHGYGDHGRFLYREQLRVPLIMAGPGIAPATPDRLVRLVDIYPTLVEWAGVPEAAAAIPAEGYSLFDASPTSGGLSPRLAFAQRRPKNKARHRRSWEDGEVRSLQTRRYKYIAHSMGPDEFFDLEQDPWEFDNRIDEESQIQESLRRRLDAYLAQWDPPASDTGDETTEHDDELRALGYL